MSPETATPVQPVQPGEAAPAFSVPAVNREGTVSLDDFRGRTPVLIGLFRGLHCPFCRRQIALLGATQDKLRDLGVEILAVVNTPLDRARLYFGYRPVRVLLAADPEASMLEAFRMPAIEVVDDPARSQWPQRITVAEMSQVRVNAGGELSEPTPLFEATETLNAKDGFEMTEADQQMLAARPVQGTGHFLLDRAGIVRWRFIEGGEGIAHITKFPSDAEILEAARTLAR
jgi:peroxiredoxin